MSKHKLSHRLLALTLSIVMVVGMMPVTAVAQADTDLKGEIIAFEELSEEITNQEVVLGTLLEDLVLPKTLNVTVRIPIGIEEDELEQESVQDSGDLQQNTEPDAQEGQSTSDQEQNIVSDTLGGDTDSDSDDTARGNDMDSVESVQTTSSSAVVLGESDVKDNSSVGESNETPTESEFMEMNIPVPTEWTSSPDYDGEKTGIYTFTARVDGFALASDVDLPQITVTVDKATSGGKVTSFETMEDHIRWQNTLEPYFPETLLGRVEGEITEIPVKWYTEQNYDEKSPQKGLYIFTAVVGEDYSLAGDVELPLITVYIPKSSGGFNIFAMGGDGRADSPLEITTAAQLAEIATLVNLGRLEQFLFNDAKAKANLVLMNNIDLSAYGRNFNDGKGWIPIGWAMSESPYTQYSFKGNFDGDGHIISGLYIHDTSINGTGFFGAVFDGSIKNLGLQNVEIIGGNYTGGVVGTISGLVENCYVTGMIKGHDRVGGIVGLINNMNTIKNCYSTASVSGNYNVGGIVGSLNGILENSAALNSSVSGNGLIIGRVVGGMASATLTNNIAFSGMEILVNGSPKSDMGNANDHIDGLGKSADDIKSDGTLGDLFKNDNGWTTADGSLPGFGAAVEMPRHIIDLPTGEFFEGTGVEGNEYKISTPQQLAKLADLVNNGDDDVQAKYNTSSVHYKMTADLDLSGYGKNFNSGEGWVPVGRAKHRFKGNFNGGNHIITGLYINRVATEHTGLFGFADENSKIENLGIVDADITVTAGESAYGAVGGIAGRVGSGALNQPGGTVQNCFVTGTISGNQFAGGIVGYFTGMMKNCYSAAEVTSNRDSGGVVYNISKGSLGSTLENCYAISSVKGADNVGGIAASVADGATIKNSAALNPSASANGDYSNVGRVTTYSTFYEGTLINNIAFNGMTVIKDGNPKDPIGNAGDNVDGLSKTATEIAADNFFQTLFSSNTAWTYTNGGLPILAGFADGVQDSTLPPHLVDGAASPYFYGTGADEANAYQISTPEQLAKLAELVNSEDEATRIAYRSKYYKLMKDIDISGYGKNFNEGKGWTPIGINFTISFRGHFDGNGKTITGLYIRRTDPYTGLFGNINGGTVKNLGVINADIQSVSSNVGGMAGELFSGRIENCYVTGSVGGEHRVGGVVGIINSDRAIVINCYSSATVSATGYYAGGIAGFMINDNTTVESCYSTGSISGVDYVGGIVGDIYSTTDTVRNSVALNPSVIGTGSNVSRVAGSNSGTLQNNYAFSGMTGGGMDKTLNGLDGQDLTMGKDLTTQAGNAAFWTTEDNWDTENNGTVWDSTVWTFTDGKLPTLKNVGGNQSGDGGLHFIQRDISGANVTVNGIYPYNGSNIFDYDFTLVFDGHTLEPIKDYTIDHGAVGKDVGSYNLSIFGNGNYKGSKTTSFTISKATPTVDDINIVSSPNLSYNGSSKEYGYKVIESKTGMGAITVYYEGVDGTIYVKSATAPTNAGTYKITLDIAEGTNFTAATGLDVNDTFTITPKSVSADMIGELATQTYIGSQIKPKPTITDTAIGGGTQLTEGVDFEYSYGQNLYAGNNAGSVSVTGKGNYAGTTDVKTFDIVASEQTPAITNAVNLTRGAKTLDLRTLVTDAMGEISFTLAEAGGTGSTLEGYTLTSGNTMGEVKINLNIAGVDINNDGTPEYSPFSQENAITVTIVNKPTQDDFTFSQATKSKLYSDSDFTIVATGSVPGSTVTYTSDDESIAAVNADTGMVTVKKVGSTSIKATASETADYAEASASYTLTVDKATITITAKDKAAYRGSTVPAFTVDDYIVTGLRTGETLATLPTLAYETEPDMSKTGAIAIQASGAEAPVGDNYNDIVYVDGRLTISNKPSGGGGGSYNPPVITPETPEVQPDQPIKVIAPVTAEAGINGVANTVFSITTITEAIKKANEAAKAQGNTANGIWISLVVKAPEKTTSLELVLTQQVLKQLVDNKVQQFEVNGHILSLNFNQEAIRKIQSQSNGDVTITIKPVTMNGVYNAYDITFNYRNSNGEEQSIINLGNGSVILSIPYTPDANEVWAHLYAVHVDEEGNINRIPGSFYDEETGSIIFSTNHFSIYGVGYEAPTAKFTDVGNHWAKEDIEFVVGRGLFSGTSDNTFSPNIAMTRGMFVTVLGRLANADISNYKESSFTDVKSDAYYMGSIEWASKNNIVNGIGNGRFAPDQSITREQMAVIMTGYAKTIGFTLPKVHVENTFTDNAKISTYAKDAVKQMQLAGVISGKNGNLFDPQGTATRAEVSAVLRRFVELAISSNTMQGWARNDSGQWMCRRI